jgi:hypothetical protein
MASTVANPPKERVRHAGHPADNVYFDLAIALLGAIFAFGLYLDGWAHNHGMVDQSFFTPWHAALYGSFALTGVCLVGSHFYNTMRGYAWDKALPRGYMPALIAVFLFAIGGLADLGWHISFGIEEDTEALLSPSHLLLAVSIFTILASPFAAIWQRNGQPKNWLNYLPLLLSAAMILSIISFFSQFVGLMEFTQLLIGRRPSEHWWRDSVSIAAVLLNTGVMAGLILFMLRRWTLPFGSVSLMLVINAALMIWMNEDNRLEYVYFGGAMLLSGLLIDGLIFWLKPSPEKILANRIIGAAIPFIVALSLMGALQFYGMAMVERGIWWKIHMWLGTPVLSGILGLFLSYLVFPPAIPQD